MSQARREVPTEGAFEAAIESRRKRKCSEGSFDTVTLCEPGPDTPTPNRDDNTHPRPRRPGPSARSQVRGGGGGRAGTPGGAGSHQTASGSQGLSSLSLHLHLHLHGQPSPSSQAWWCPSQHRSPAPDPRPTHPYRVTGGCQEGLLGGRLGHLVEPCGVAEETGTWVPTDPT